MFLFLLLLALIIHPSLLKFPSAIIFLQSEGFPLTFHLMNMPVLSSLKFGGFGRGGNSFIFNSFEGF